MSVLIMHHVEECWSDAMDDMGVDYEEYLQRLFDHIQESNYSHIINTRFEDISTCGSLHSVGDEYATLGNLVNMVYDYGYGWDLDESGEKYTQDGEEYRTEHGTVFVDGGNHSTHVLIPEWIDNHISDEIDLVGAFDGECLEDMEIVLRHKGIKYNKIKSLIV